MKIIIFSLYFFFVFFNGKQYPQQKYNKTCTTTRNKKQKSRKTTFGHNNKEKHQHRVSDSRITVRSADAVGGASRPLVGIQVYFPESSGVSVEMCRDPSTIIFTRDLRDLRGKPQQQRHCMNMYH